MESDMPSRLYRIVDRVGNNVLWSCIYTQFVDGLGLRGNERVLDFGSGSGAGARHIAKRLSTGRLVCVDVSPYWMQVCRKRLSKYPRTEFHLGHLPELSLPKASFDVVSIHYALHEVAKNEQEAIVLEMSGLLKDEGSLYIKEPQREGDGMPIETIRSLFSGAGLVEHASWTGKNWFQGEYRKSHAILDEMSDS